MSAHPGRRSHRQNTPAQVIPFFVCSGAKDVPRAHDVFRFGEGTASPVACPRRHLCAWYAAHDLGGTLAFNELPEAILLHADFDSAPFHCARFADLTRLGALALNHVAAK